MIRKPVIVTAVVTALSSGILLGGTDIKTTSAYFTDQEFHTNIYTFGDITADGTETEWNPEEASHLLPNEMTAKNPVLVNTGDNAAVGFIVLDSPLLKEAVTADETGTRIVQNGAEIWTYLDASGKEGFSAEWIPVETGFADAGHKQVSDEKNAVYKRRIFGFKDGLPGRNGETYAKTAPLFSAIKTMNYVEGSVKESDLHGIDVYFLAVQADNLQLENGTVTTEASTKNMNASTLQSIWQILGKNADFASMPNADTEHRLDLNGGRRNEKGGTAE